MRGRLPIALLVLVAVASAALAGPQAFGKIAHIMGFRALALRLVEDPAARAALLYQVGRYAEADAAFAAIGRSATYNRANTLAATGRYALSVDYYDAVLFADRFDGDARHNREIVDALVPPVVGEAKGQGRIRAILAEAGVATRPPEPDDPRMLLAEANKAGRKPISDRTVAADRAWLETLADAPGEFLRNRLAAEHARRVADGRAAEPEALPW